MAKKSSAGKTVRCRYFEWRVYTRQGIYQADGRRSVQNLSRYSLGTEHYEEALNALQELDIVQAIRHGLASPEERTVSSTPELSLTEGRQVYETHLARPKVAKGVRETTRKRYRAVFDKFLAFCTELNVHSWNRVTSQVLQQYLSNLEQDYAQATVYLEGNFIKQVINYFIEQNRLPSDSRIELSLEKSKGTSTYCYRPGEVTAIVHHCRAIPKLSWLGDVIAALATTGLRISELAALRWIDLSDDWSSIELTDESGRITLHSEERRTIKTGKNRVFPVHPDLRRVLETIPQDHREIFRGPRGGRLKPDVVLANLKREVLQPLAASDASDISSRLQEGRVHSFRHYF